MERHLNRCTRLLCLYQLCLTTLIMVSPPQATLFMFLSFSGTIKGHCKLKFNPLRTTDDADGPMNRMITDAQLENVKRAKESCHWAFPWQIF
jgi:hypothetical protein